MYVAGIGWFHDDIISYYDRWVVRKSQDNGLTWTTVDDGSTIIGAIPSKVLIGPHDEVIVVGTSSAIFFAVAIFSNIAFFWLGSR